MSQPLTPNELARLFPNASKSCVAANGGNRHSKTTVMMEKVLKHEGTTAIHSEPYAEPKRLTVTPSTDEEKLNKTERAFLATLRAGNPTWLGIQNVTLKLAFDCRFTPDFATIKDGAITFFDVKGWQREDALIKMKMAARLFTWAQFVIVKKDKLGWKYSIIKP